MSWLSQPIRPATYMNLEPFCDLYDLHMFKICNQLILKVRTHFVRSSQNDWKCQLKNIQKLIREINMCTFWMTLIFFFLLEGLKWTIFRMRLLEINHSDPKWATPTKKKTKENAHIKQKSRICSLFTSWNIYCLKKGKNWN